MDAPSAETLITTAVGVGGVGTGGLSVGWIAKILIERYIKNNDKKHELSSKAISTLADAQKKSNAIISNKLEKITVDLEVIKARMGEVMSTRDDVKVNTKDVAIALERIKGNAEDIDKGFASVRDQLKHARQELSDIKRLKPV